MVFPNPLRFRLTYRYTEIHLSVWHRRFAGKTTKYVRETRSTKAPAVQNPWKISDRVQIPRIVKFRCTVKIDREISFFFLPENDETIDPRRPRANAGIRSSAAARNVSLRRSIPRPFSTRTYNPRVEITKRKNNRLRARSFRNRCSVYVRRI